MYQLLLFLKRQLNKQINKLNKCVVLLDVESKTYFFLLRNYLEMKGAILYLKFKLINYIQQMNWNALWIKVNA